jgi:hypothetical protein
MAYKPIIDPEAYNGRMNLEEPTDPNARFAMFEKVSLRNAPTEYSNAMLNEWEATVLSQVFFSKENAQIIQNGIRAGVYARSNNQYVLPNQNAESLRIIMRSVYVQHARHLNEDVTAQVQHLNDLVLDYAVPFCYSEAVAYMKYLRDQTALPVPLAHAPQTDRDYKQLEANPW